MNEPRDRYAADTSSKRPPAWLAWVVMAAGAFIVAGAIDWIPLRLSPGVPRWVGAAAGFVFILGGVAIALPPHATRAVNIVGALMVTALTTVGGWVAFAPGERQFSSSISAGAVAMSGGGNEWVGRIAFGIGAILCGAFPAYLWKRALFPQPPADEGRTPGG